jgi:hypothetical protein
MLGEAKFRLDTRQEIEGGKVKKQMEGLVKDLHKKFPQLVFPASINIANEGAFPAHIETKLIFAGCQLVDGRNWPLEKRYYSILGQQIIDGLRELTENALAQPSMPKPKAQK